MNPQCFPRFQLLVALFLLLQVSVRSQGVSEVSLYRAAFYQQSGNSAPQPIPNTPDESPFFALAVMAMDDEFLSDPEFNLIFVRAVTLQPPTGSLRALEFDLDYGGFFYVESFTSKASLENAYRAGNYRFMFGSAISGDSFYDLAVEEGVLPAPPQVSNFDAAQNIDPTQPFLLHWTPDAPALGGAQLEVYDQADGNLVYDSEPIVGAVSSVQIPAGTLLAGHTYRAEILLIQFDNADGSAASATSTRLPLAAASGNVPAPVINSITLNGTDEVVFVVGCTPGVPLNLQQTGVLGGGWETLQTVTPTTSPTTLTVPAAQVSAVSFFQVTQ